MGGIKKTPPAWFPFAMPGCLTLEGGDELILVIAPQDIIGGKLIQTGQKAQLGHAHFARALFYQVDARLWNLQNQRDLSSGQAGGQAGIAQSKANFAQV